MNLRTFYLVLAIVGAVAPYIFFVQYLQEAGFGLTGFVSALFVNGASGGFTADLLISSLVFWIFMFDSRRKNGGPAPTAFILLNLLIGLSCALPAWLYARELHTASD